MKPYQIIKSPKVFDTCIVGSGAGGGMVAKVLAEAGFEIVFLETGPEFDSARGGTGKNESGL